MSDPNQNEINEKILSDLASLRSEQATSRSENKELRKMFEEMMKNHKGKEPANFDETSQNDKISSTYADVGGSFHGPMLSPRYNDQRSSSLSNMRMPPPPNIQFERGQNPPPQARMSQMPADPSHFFFTPA